MLSSWNHISMQVSQRKWLVFAKLQINDIIFLLDFSQGKFYVPLLDNLHLSTTICGQSETTGSLKITMMGAYTWISVYGIFFVLK